VLDYGSEYDFSVPFFEQFKQLQLCVPRASLYRDNFVDSEYCNYGTDFRECYLVFGGKGNERVYFGNQLLDCSDSFDIDYSTKNEFCYENFECTRSSKLFFSAYSQECIDSSYLVDCRNCVNCFACIGLLNKQYCILNEQYSKEEYEKRIKEFSGSYKAHLGIEENLKQLSLSVPHRFARIYKSVNSDGDDLSECRNTHMAFSSSQVEDSKFLFYIRMGSKDCYDNTFLGWGAELIYEVAHGFGNASTAFGTRNLYTQDAKYNEECRDCKDIIGCVGLRNKQFCIFNTQYSKEEYEELAPKIFAHMSNMPYIDKAGITYKYGEFFPSELSPFAYNESIAQEFFPLTKEEALKKNFRWQDDANRNYKIDFSADALPDKIVDVDDSIVGKIISCSHNAKCKHQCTEAFKILPEELVFYKRMNLPLPRLCPNCRHYERMQKRNPLKLWHRSCMNKGCQNEFETSYAPERPEIIYCESCYQSEMI
jgi:hypothetical protein